MRISWQGRVVTTLAGARAARFRREVEDADEEAAQLLHGPRHGQLQARQRAALTANARTATGPAIRSTVDLATVPGARRHLRWACALGSGAHALGPVAPRRGSVGRRAGRVTPSWLSVPGRAACASAALSFFARAATSRAQVLRLQHLGEAAVGEDLADEPVRAADADLLERVALRERQRAALDRASARPPGRRARGHPDVAQLARLEAGPGVEALLQERRPGACGRGGSSAARRACGPRSGRTTRAARARARAARSCGRSSPRRRPRTRSRRAAARGSPARACG